MADLISRAGIFAVLGATNEAVLRASTRAELFQRVCEAAVHEGGLCLAVSVQASASRFVPTTARMSKR